jgi:cell wall-associated NlpC family hydrolase
MSWVEKYIGIPYRKYGREREEGLDCWGLVREVYKQELGITLPSFMGEYEADSKRVFFNSVHRVFDAEKSNWIKAEKPKEFDVAAFHRFGVVWHTGICIDKDKMLHLEGKAGSLVEPFAGKGFNIYGFYRWKSK